MTISKETQDWLNDLKAAGNLTDEEFKAIEAAAGKTDSFIKDSVLRQSDYSRRQTELKTERDRLTQAQSEAAEYQRQLAQWKTTADARFDAALKDAEKAKVAEQQAAARLRTIAAQYNIPEEVVAANMTQHLQTQQGQQPSPQQQAQTPDLSNYLTKADFENAATGSLLLQTAIHDLSVRHQALFGEPLKDATALVREAIAAKQSLEDFWSSKYKVAEKQAAITEEAVQQRIQTAVKEAETKLASEYAMRGGNVVSPTREREVSVLFQRPTERKAGEARVNAVDKAVAAFNQGTYRDGVIARQ